MKSSWSIAALIGAFLTLGACHQDLRMATTSGAVPSRDLQICAASGGTLQARGKAGRLVCVHPYSDAGKSCSSRSDCHGRCLADASAGGLPKAGEPAIGHCQADDRLFGCYAEVQNGKARPGICVD